MSRQYIYQIEGLTKKHGQKTVLDDIHLAFYPGAKIGVLGPNGAGKSTLMRLLCGYLPLTDAGRLKVDGLDVATDSLKVRARVGYMPEHVPLYPELRVAEHLGFRAAIKRVPRRARAAEVERVAGKTGLTDRLEQPISQLSRGYRQRVGIADALLGDPPLIVLDEPTVGLDPNQVLEIRAMLRALGGDHTLVFSSHILAEVEALCDRVVILSRGEVVVDEPLAEALSAGHVLVRLATSPERVQTLVDEAWRTLGHAGPPTTEPVLHDEDTATARLVLPEGTEAEPVLAAIGAVCAAHEIHVRTLALGRTRLEERFAAVTGARRADH